MSDDVLERANKCVGNVYQLVDEMADEIERLRAALLRIVESRVSMIEAVRIAQQALNGDDR